MKKPAGTLIFLVAIALSLVPGLSAVRSEEKKVYLPVPPETEYYKLRHLMGDGMMPNYKALWSAFRYSDADNMRAALHFMSALAREVDRYPPPEKNGSLDDFKHRMNELERKTESLSADLGAAMDRSAISSRILSIYQSCQSCHDVYAPAERMDERKYSPPR